MTQRSIDAVLFDWGGTLTPWHDVDFEAEARALAAAVTGPPTAVSPNEFTEADRADHARRLEVANQTVWMRSRDHQKSSTVHDVFAEAGLDHDPALLHHYYEFWDPHTRTDPHVAPLLAGLRDQGLKVGVLSNTIWPRDVHIGFFERDGVAHLIDGDIYTSEVPWTKPSPEVFWAAMVAVGVTEPGRCVYVGDRLFDDVWGAQNAGLRTIYVPHSTIPTAQIGHSLGEPDATVQSLAEVAEVVANWL